MYLGTHAAQYPDKAAVVVAETGEVTTYSELESSSARLAHWFRAENLCPDTHIAVISHNTPEVFTVYWAAMRSGLYITMVNSHLSPSEMVHIVNDCGAQAVFVSARLADTVAEVAPFTPLVKQTLTFAGTSQHFRSVKEVVAGLPDVAPTDQPRGADMLYSSGTTGHPKGIKARRPTHQIGTEPYDEVTQFVTAAFGYSADSIYLSPAPIYHAAPLRYCAAIHTIGGTVVMMERFDAEDALRAIETYRATDSMWVPTHFVRMLKLDEAVRESFDLSSLRTAVHAAAPCPIEVKLAMLEWWGDIIYEMYSATEANGITLVDSAGWRDKPGTVGRDGIIGTVHICGPDDAELPTGEIGTIYFERETLPFEYHNDPEKTRATQHPKHPTWTAVGDVGYLDEDRFLFLTDRSTFMIISGGVNIYPQEVENCLSVHPKVLDVAVIGVPDAEMGEVVKAVVQPMPGFETGESLAGELLDYTRARIAKYKCPRSIDFVDELPRTPTGKLQKGKVRDTYRNPPSVA